MKTIELMKKIHFALASGVTIFLGLVFYIGYSKAAPQAGSIKIGETLVLQSNLAVAFAVLGSFLSNVLYKNIMSRKSENRPAQYQSAHIIRLALVEGPALYGCVLLFLFVSAHGPIQWNLFTAKCLVPVLGFYVTIISTIPNGKNIPAESL